jgi:hypothetical protein
MIKFNTYIVKKILVIVVLSLLFSWNIFAAETIPTPENTTVNFLLKNGWRLYSTNAVAFSGSDGRGETGVYYNLIKGRNIITCAASSGKVFCNKP